MTIQSFEGNTPVMANGAYVADCALLIGQVTIGRDASVWPGAIIRGDIHQIQIGERTNIQDNSVIHVTHDGRFHPGGYPTTIGNEVIVGHRVILHGCHISDRCLIGMGAIIMDGAVVESHVILAAGSLVPPGKTLSGGYLWMGSPAKRIRPLTDREIEEIEYSANYYVELKNRYLK